MPRARSSLRRTASDGGALAFAAREREARLACRDLPERRASRAGRRTRTIRLGVERGRMPTLGAAGPPTWGAKVEGVALGFMAFGVETAEGAALGL
jgi:hypothetical protein